MRGPARAANEPTVPIQLGGMRALATNTVLREHGEQRFLQSSGQEAHSARAYKAAGCMNMSALPVLTYAVARSTAPECAAACGRSRPLIRSIRMAPNRNCQVQQYIS